MDNYMSKNDVASLSVSVTIPAEKIYAQTMLLVDEYKPLVEEALDEAREEILKDEAFKKTLKETIKRKLHDTVEKTMNDAIGDIASEIMRLRYHEFRDLAGEVLDINGARKSYKENLQ